MGPRFCHQPRFPSRQGERAAGSPQARRCRPQERFWLPAGDVRSGDQLQRTNRPSPMRATHAASDAPPARLRSSTARLSSKKGTFLASARAHAADGHEHAPVARASGLLRTPLSGGVNSATISQGLPPPALAVRNLMEQARTPSLQQASPSSPHCSLAFSWLSIPRPSTRT